MQRILTILALFLTGPALAADGHDDSHHLSEAGGVRILHAWTVETRGDNAPVYMEIENARADEIILRGGETEAGADVTLVAVNYSSDGARPEPIGDFPIPAGSELALTPDGLYLLITGLTGPLSEGDAFDLHVILDPAGEVEVHVDVEAEGATKHPHAGHRH